MRRNRAKLPAPGWRVSFRSPRVGLIIAAIAAVAGPYGGHAALAHSLLVSRGDAVITSDDVRVTIDVFAEDFLHYEPLQVDADGSLDLAELTAAAERHGVALAGELTVIDGRGARLACVTTTTHPGWSDNGRVSREELRSLRTRYDLTFRLLTPTPVLTFRSVGSGIRTGVQSQCVLRAGCADSDVHRTLRLTSGGNAEGVELEWSGSTPRLVESTSVSGHSDLLMPFDPHGPLRFNDVCLDVSLDDEAARATVYIPLPLWESFQPVTRADENRLGADEIDALLRNAAERLRGALAVAGDPGDTDWPFVVTVDSPHISTIGDARTVDTIGSISFWSARLIVRYEPRTLRDGHAPDLSWNLYNELVMSAEAVVRSPSGSRSLGLSPYERLITIR